MPSRCKMNSSSSFAAAFLQQQARQQAGRSAGGHHGARQVVNQDSNQDRSQGSNQDSNQDRSQDKSQTKGFQLEEALFSTAPVGMHCVDCRGVVLWANRAELDLLGYPEDEYVGRPLSSFVYSPSMAAPAMAAPAMAAPAMAAPSMAAPSMAAPSMAELKEQAETREKECRPVMHADDKALYKEVLKQIASGSAIQGIPIRFVSRSGTVVHLLLDCDAVPIRRHDAFYFRCFTRDDTARRIQEMRSNVLFQETDRSLQMLDNFMNRAMHQMRLPLTLMERACDLVAENIEDIDEVLRRNALLSHPANLSTNLSANLSANFFNLSANLPANLPAASSPATASASSAAAINAAANATQSLQNSASHEPAASSSFKHTAASSKSQISAFSYAHRNSYDSQQDAKPQAFPTPPNTNINSSFDAHSNLNFSTPVAAALSAASEARSVVGLASALVHDASAFVDDITDLCRFDQGQVLVIDKEAVKIRDVCLEALLQLKIPLGVPANTTNLDTPTISPGMVQLSLNIQEGAPGRAMTDRTVLQRCLSLLLDFAVDAAANAASSHAANTARKNNHSTDTTLGKVIINISDAALDQPQASKSSCKISVFYTNPPEGAADRDNGTETTCSTAQSIMKNADEINTDLRSGAYGTARPVFSECNTKLPMASNRNLHHQRDLFGFEENEPMHDTHHDHRYNADSRATYSPNGRQGGGGGGGSSMMRRIKLRESVERGMTKCRRDKLGLGLSLLYHLVGAQGSDLRYEIVAEEPPSPKSPATSLSSSSSHLHHSSKTVILPSMTKFWFLLPMSLDFPERLPGERIYHHDLQPHHQSIFHSLTKSPSYSAFAAAPDDSLELQPPPRKKIKTNEGVVARDTIVNDLSLVNNNVATSYMGNIEYSSLLQSLSANAGFASAPAIQPETSSKPNSPTTIIASAPPPIKQYPGVAPGARPLVLVVEDTDVSASLLCMHLRKLNCTSHRAENGEVALEMLRAAPAPNMYSLILMDLRMPVMDGFEATTIIKGSNASNIPVVALTGETSEENKRKCDVIGFDDYKTKPLKRPQLKELLLKFVPGYQFKAS